MKKCILILILLTFMTGCSEDVSEKTDEKVVIDGIELVEGCYTSSDLNADKLLLHCFTESKEYYDVLFKDGNYYLDTYLNNSPDHVDENYKKTFTYDEGFLEFTLYQDGSRTLYEGCVVQSDNESYSCEAIISGGGDGTYNYNKIDKDFTEEEILELPLYDRHAPFEIVMPDKNVYSCNMTRNYSVIETLSSTVIKECITQNKGEEYVVTQADSSGNWQIYPKRIETEQASGIPYYDTVTDYVIDNYSYNLTMNGKEFTANGKFPIDPFTSEEKLVISITSK